MMSLVIDGLVNLLSAAPDPLLEAGQLGDKAPFTSADVPAVSVALSIDRPLGNGVGRFLREGHQLVQTTTVVEVKSSPDTFSADLRTLRVSPLPLRRSPSARSEAISGNDVTVNRVNDPDHPIAYRFTAAPASREEFTVEVTNALIHFGAPQAPDDKLEVSHWTMAFREDVVSVRYSGTVALDVWERDLPKTGNLARRLQRKLAAPPATLRERGFVTLQPAGLEAAQGTLQQPGTGSPFPVCKQRLAYRFVFESELGGEASGGGAIRRIDVTVDDQMHETFSTPPKRTEG